MPESLRYDAVPIKAIITAEGYIRDSPVVGRSGIQEYRRVDGTLRREYRPPDVVFAEDSLGRISGIPIIDQHVGLMTAKNVREHSIGTVLSNGRRDGNDVVADVIIHDPTPITKHGRKELSLAYAVSVDETPGITPEGESYDARVLAITRYDHLAIVAKGRAGNAKLRLDSDDAVSIDLHEDIEDADNLELNSIKEDQTIMADPVVNNTVVPGAKLVVVRIDGIEYSAVPEVERELNRARAEAVAAQKRADEAEAARDTAQATIAKHAAELTQARADAASAARVRLELEGVAKAHGVEVRSDASDRNIRESVIRKISGETIKFDGKSDDYVLAAFDGAVESAVKAKANSERNRATVNGAGNPAGTVRADAAPLIKPAAINSAATARELMLRRGSIR